MSGVNQEEWYHDAPLCLARRPVGTHQRLLGFHLTPRQACDLDGADVLLNQLAADTLLADRGYDADERVIERLDQQDKMAVIPPKRNRTKAREYDKDLYKARHLIENL